MGYINEDSSRQGSRSDRAQLSFIFATSLNFMVMLMKYLRATSAEVLTQQFLFQHLRTNDLFLCQEISVFKTKSNSTCRRHSSIVKWMQVPIMVSRKEIKSWPQWVWGSHTLTDTMKFNKHPLENDWNSINCAAEWPFFWSKSKY